MNEITHIGLLGHYGNKNLGDEASITAVIQAFKRYRPDITIVGFSANPQDTFRRHNIDAYPIRRIVLRPYQTRQPVDLMTETGSNRLKSGLVELKSIIKQIPILFQILKSAYYIQFAIRQAVSEIHFLIKSRRILSNIDLLIITGSGQLHDDFGRPFLTPYTLFKWSVLARLSSTRSVFMSVGAGPLDAAVSRLFARASLHLATYRSYRDDYSRRFIAKVGFKGESYVFPDLACSLDTSRIVRNFKPSPRDPIVGVNPIPYCDSRYWPVHDNDRYRTYVEKTAALVRELVNQNYIVSLFPTKLISDNLTIDDIMAVLRNDPGFDKEDRLLIKDIDSLEDLLNHILECDIIVSSRFHGVLLSCLMHRPTIGMSYHPKTIDMLNYMGLTENYFDIETFEVVGLLKKLQFVMVHSDQQISALERNTIILKKRLDDQYEKILELLPR